MYGFGNPRGRINDQRQELIDDIRKIETNANATLLTDTANMASPQRIHTTTLLGS
jgi:hypothetical protein